MQSVGLAYCLIPGLRHLYPDPTDMHRAVTRYKAPFNTHPFLAGAIAGAVLKLDEEGKKSGEIARFMHGTMGPLAALGDPFFRNALPALVAIAASLAALLGGALAGILTLVLLFNAAHVTVRIGGVVIGYREGYNVLPRLANWLSPTHALMVKKISAVGAGLVLVIAADKFGPEVANTEWRIMFVAAGGILAAAALVRWRIWQHYGIPLALAAMIVVEVWL